MKLSEFSKGHLLMFTATLFFSFNFIALKYLMPHWMTGLDATFFRVCGGGLLFWLGSFFIKNTPILKSDRSEVFFSGLLGLFPFIVFFNMSLEYSSIIDVSIIMTTPPVLVAIASAIIYKTKISFLNGLGIALSLGGAIFLILIGKTGGGSGRDMLGNIFAIISAVAYSYYLITMGKFSSKYHPISLLRWVFLSASIGALPLGIIFLGKSEFVQHPSIVPILVVAFVIIFPSFLSFMMIPASVKRIGHQLVSMYQDLIPVLATILAVILKMDKLYWDQPVAIVVILVGVFISSRAVQKEQYSVK